ncbi:9057_t:CDS:2, partial [Racocetra persica]
MLYLRNVRKKTKRNNLYDKDYLYGFPEDLQNNITFAEYNRKVVTAWAGLNANQDNLVNNKKEHLATIHNVLTNIKEDKTNIVQNAYTNPTEEFIINVGDTFSSYEMADLYLNKHAKSVEFSLYHKYFEVNNTRSYVVEHLNIVFL